MRKITINCAKNKFFWVNEAFDILTLRYQFRLIGNLIKIPKLGSKFNFFLFLSLEEVLIGLETGFLKIKILLSHSIITVTQDLNFLKFGLEICK